MIAYLLTNVNIVLHTVRMTVYNSKQLNSNVQQATKGGVSK